jgi:hypothetical protein
VLFHGGHVLKKNEKFSYLLPIGSDDSLFINRITGAELSRVFQLLTYNLDYLNSVLHYLFL